MEMRFAAVCSRCGAKVPPGFVPTCPGCGGMVEVEYDPARVRLHDEDNPYRRFRDLLPVQDAGLLPGDARPTPTIHAVRLGEALGLSRLYLKDETVHPTGTTKDRMAAVALAFLCECGVRDFCTSSTGNSSTAFAAAIPRFPGMRLHLFTAAGFGDRVWIPDSDRVVHTLLEGATFVDAFVYARRFAERHGYTTERGFFNPGRREGLKLAFLEAADQVPEPFDWYVQAVSSAMGVVGTWKGARELAALGRIPRPPRLLCVQQETCAPMVRAWRDGSAVIRPEDIVRNPRGIAMAILRGDPSGAYPYVHRAVTRSEGTMVSVGETEIREARDLVASREGVDPCYSAAAAVAGLARAAREGAVDRDQAVLVNLTGRERPPVPPVRTARRLVRSGDDWVPAEPERAGS